MGLLSLLKSLKNKSPKQKGTASGVREKSHDVDIKLTYEITVTPSSDTDLLFTELHKDASRLDREGKLDKAIEKLHEANNLERKEGVDYTVKRSLRLPLFLQKSGRFDEAIVEFHAVIDELPERVKRMSPTISENVKEAGLQSDLSIVYDKMRLACKREGKSSEATQYASVSAKHEKNWEDLHVIIRSERKARSTAWRNRNATTKTK